MAEIRNAVEVKNLVKSFGSKIAVSHLTFDVPEGTITGFIGPNGAGKTTTLRMLATLLKPDCGTIKIFGRDTVSNGQYVRHQLGFMPDYFGLYEDMEVEEYLDFFAAAYHIPLHKRKQLIQDLLQLLDLSVKKNSLIGELSRGMQQRLSLGRSLVHDPKLLLLDEPASGLDPRARIELMELLRELRTMGKTIFISSHILFSTRRNKFGKIFEIFGNFFPSLGAHLMIFARKK
jgi:ABC-2 type transport system ATP-binding protein